MALRTISAIVGIPLVLSAVWAGLPWLSLLVAFLASLGALEFYRMAEQRDARPSVVLGVVWTLAFVIGGHMGGWPTPWVLLGGTSVAFLWHQLRRLARLLPWGKDGVDFGGLNDSLVDWAYTCAGALYTGWTLSLALVLRGEVQGLEWVLVAVLGTFATDTGAFFVGRALGRRRLAPRISPNKTWEGAVGGFFFGVGAVVALASGLDMALAPWEGVVLGAMVGVSAQAGDLVESAIKRASGVKDAGKLIPGHGGILDRLDSVVFVLVVVYHFSIWMA